MHLTGQVSLAQNATEKRCIILGTDECDGLFDPDNKKKRESARS